MSVASIPQPTGDDVSRWDFSRLVRRILYGEWEQDLQRKTRDLVGSTRKSAWATVDISANMVRTTCDALAVIYDQEPIVRHSQDAVLSKELALSGIWALMKRVQRDTLGLREMLVRVDIASDGTLQFQPVYPDTVVAYAAGDKPAAPYKLEHVCKWTHPVTRKEVYLWAVHDIEDPAAPDYRLVRRENGVETDVTAEYLGQTYQGQDYPYRWADGTPFIPYVLYHAQNTGRLWDPYASKELVEGTLNLGVYYSLLGHCIRTASWPQRYGIGIQLAGGSYGEMGDGQEAQSPQVAPDPSMVVLFEPVPEFTGQPVVSQWEPGSDPQALAETIALYERRLVSLAGVNPADLQRASGDPRSGYALAISREAQRAAQRRYEGQFRVGDLELIAKAAALFNLAHGTSIPETGWTIVYRAIPRSAEEERELRDNLTWQLTNDLITKDKAYALLYPEEETESESEPEPVSPDATAAPAVDASQPLAATALNGAQVTAAQGIVQAVATGQLPRESGVAMLVEFFQLSQPAAERVMGNIGRGFKPAVLEDAA